MNSRPLRSHMGCGRLMLAGAQVRSMSTDHLSSRTRAGCASGQTSVSVATNFCGRAPKTSNVNCSASIRASHQRRLISRSLMMIDYDTVRPVPAMRAAKCPASIMTVAWRAGIRSEASVARRVRLVAEMRSALIFPLVHCAAELPLLDGCLDGLDGFGRLPVFSETRMVIGFWTALDVWTAPLLF
jgi:hypothetical protein